MKIKTIIALFIMVFLLSTKAMSIGIVLGGNYSKFSKDFNSFKKENNYILRSKIGVLNEIYDASSLVSIEYGILLDQKGNKYTFEDYEDTVLTNLNTRIYTRYSKLNYITIPVFIKKSFGEYNNRMTINFGAYFSKLLSINLGYKPDHYYYQNYKSKLLGDTRGYKGTDYGIAFGIGKQFNNIQINLNYYKSLKNLSNYDYKIKQSTIELSCNFLL